MKILLIACSYPPDPFVGSFRAAKVANALRAAGHDVQVITSRLPGEGPLRIDEPGLRVHTVQDMRGPRAAYRALRRRFGGANGGPPSREQRGAHAAAREDSRWAAHAAGPAAGHAAAGAANGRRHVRAVPRWKRYLLSIIWVPDNRQGFIPAALRRARSLMAGVDLVYTTAPPFSDHLVGLVLKHRTGVRWAAEFRDPWTENANRHAHLRSRPMDALNRLLERRCVEQADQLIAVSEGTASLLRAKLPAAQRDKVVLALNGIDNLAPAATTASDGPIRVAHIGNCYGTRDPRLFLHALAAVVRRRDLGEGDVRVDFIGNCRSFRGESLEQLVGDLGIAHIVHFADWMPQREARARARRADLFLLPFPRERGIIPNKLFDYLGFRKPVLGFVHPEGEAARILARLGGHFLVTEQSLAAAEAAVEDALLNARTVVANEARDALLQELTTDRQMGRLLAELGLTPAG